jgi:hypothetical protein
MNRTQKQAPPPYLSPKELAERWRCSRSSVDRIAQRAGLRRVCLGGGTRGMVRYVREEVERYEQSRLVWRPATLPLRPPRVRKSPGAALIEDQGE